MDTISNYTKSGNHRFPKRPELHTIPPEYTWAEPSNYGGCPLKFMAGETRHASGSPNPNYQVVDLDCETSFKLVPFSKTPAAVAVTGLCGCTSIIIVSRRGAWANHIVSYYADDLLNVRKNTGANIKVLSGRNRP